MRNVTRDGLSCVKWPRTSRGIWYGESPLIQPRMVFIYQLIVMMFFSQLLHFVLKRLNQPKFVGFLVAGIFLGPTITGQHDNIFLKKKTFPPEEITLLILWSYVGMLNLIFLVAVKTDMSVVKKNLKNASYIGLTSVFSSYLVLKALTKAIHSADHKSTLPVSERFTFTVSTIRLPNIVYTFHELNIVASDIGQLAISTAVCLEFLSWASLVIRLAMRSTQALQIVGSSVLLVVFTITVIRPFMVRICRNTPVGQSVGETYIIVCVLLALCWAILADFIGSFYIGIFAIGLAVPSGPPLGSTLTYKIEPFVMEILMPMWYLLIGSRMNIGIISSKVFIEIICLVFIGAIIKFLGAFVTGLACKLKPKHAVLLGLMLNIRGPLDLFIFFRWNMEKEDKTSGRRPLNREYYSTLIIAELIVTMILSPMIIPLYRSCFRIRSALSNKSQRRSVQTTPDNTQLRALCCVFNEGSVPCIASLFEALNPRAISPISVHIVELTELVGGAAPHMDSYGDQLDKVKSNRLYQILVALGNYLKPYCKNDMLQVNGHSVVAPYNSMHDYICRLGHDEDVCLILVPFHKSASIIHDFDCSVETGLRTLNLNLQIHASCSVGILVDRPLSSHSTASLSQSAFYYVGVVFVGGPDDREALSLGIRMLGSPMAKVTLLRLIFDDLYRDYPDKTESKFDFRTLDEFKMKNRNNDHLGYFEMEATNADDVITGIRSYLGDRQDLIIVGKSHKIVTKALSNDDIINWTENPELGAIGDFIASSNFSNSTSLLVMQHYEMEEPRSLLTR